jgi:hypothetical protein
MPDASVTQTDVLAIDASITATTGSPGFGVTSAGFVAKPFARLLAEKLALAQALFGDGVDLTSGSVIRTVLELAALEDARTWAALAAQFDNGYASTAVGPALDLIGSELGYPRPYLEASGTIALTLTGTLPSAYPTLSLPRGARLSTPGGHAVALDQSVTLGPTNKSANVAVVAFYPGPDGNLDPAIKAADGTFPEKIDRWNWNDDALAELAAAQQSAGATPLITIAHTAPLGGGQLQWPDERYRALLLGVPRSLWTVDAIRTAVALVPGVRQVLIRDGWGGLDLRQSIFGNFNFIERLFSSERDLGSPYYFTVLVAPTPAAIWAGPDGLYAAVSSAMEDLRPIGIFPNIQQATQIDVGVQADLVVRGIPLPSGTKAFINASQAAIDLKSRLLVRLQKYIDQLEMGEPVRVSEVVWAFMNEPGIADVQNVRLLQYPPGLAGVSFASIPNDVPQTLGCGQNVTLQVDQIAVAVDDASGLNIV